MSCASHRSQPRFPSLMAAKPLSCLPLCSPRAQLQAPQHPPVTTSRYWGSDRVPRQHLPCGPCQTSARHGHCCLHQPFPPLPALLANWHSALQQGRCHYPQPPQPLMSPCSHSLSATTHFSCSPVVCLAHSAHCSSKCLQTFTLHHIAANCSSANRGTIPEVLADITLVCSAAAFSLGRSSPGPVSRLAQAPLLPRLSKAAFALDSLLSSLLLCRLLRPGWAVCCPPHLTSAVSAD